MAIVQALLGNGGLVANPLPYLIGFNGTIGASLDLVLLGYLHVLLH